MKSWIGFFSDFNVYDWGNIFNSSMCNEDSNGAFVMIFAVIDSDDEFKSLLASWSIFFSNSLPLNVIINGVSFETPRFFVVFWIHAVVKLSGLLMIP